MPSHDLVIFKCMIILASHFTFYLSLRSWQQPSRCAFFSFGSSPWVGDIPMMLFNAHHHHRWGDIPKMLGCLLLGPILCDCPDPVDLCYPTCLSFLRLVNVFNRSNHLMPGVFMWQIFCSWVTKIKSK